MFIRTFLVRLWRFIRRENLHRLIIIIVVLIAFSSISITLLEPDIDLANGFWWSIVTLTTVGYGDISPASIGGRMIAIVLMLFGIGLLGMFSATIASVLVEKKIKEDQGMNSYQFKNHIILCEWNHRSQSILNELRLDPETTQTTIVLIANIPNKPVNDENMFFVQGNVTDATLKQANLADAKSVIVLGDDRQDEASRDAKVVLTTLTIESINPKAYTIVELVDESNVQHCKRAKADEIIVSSELSSNLIARSALNHGLSKVVSEVLSSETGNELYKVPVPSTMVGQAFIDLFTQMKQTHQSITLAIQKGEDGEVISNPPNAHIAKQGDYLILVAPEKPQV